MANRGDQQVDFFVSYNKADKDWAAWVADMLVANNYTTVMQQWDFRPGENFVLRMHEAAQQARRTIGIISPDYLRSNFTAPEWAAAFGSDPQGIGAKFVPVRVVECQPPGLLASIIYIDLVGLNEEAARNELLAGVGEGRRRPSRAIAFPGRPGAHPDAVGAAMLATPLRWVGLPGSASVQWHSVQSRRSYVSNEGTRLEVQLVPVNAHRLEMRKLTVLADDLIRLGRQTALFPDAAAVRPTHDGDRAVAEAVIEGRQRTSSGLMVTRSGQRGGWLTLERDSMGPVFDETDLGEKISRLLGVLVRMPLDDESLYAIAVGLTSPMMMTRGRVSELGSRSSASGLRMTDSDVTVLPDDAVELAALRMNLAAAAEEQTARLSVAFDSSR